MRRLCGFAGEFAGGSRPFEHARLARLECAQRALHFWFLEVRRVSRTYHGSASAYVHPQYSLCSKPSRAAWWVSPRALCSGRGFESGFLQIPKRSRNRVLSRGERQRARELLGSCSGAARECLGSASGGPREGLGRDWSDRERLHIFIERANARLTVRWRDSLRYVSRVTHSVHVWDHGKHAHERAT